MVASNIKVYLRVRPCAKPSPAFEANCQTGSVAFELEKQASDLDVNNAKSSYPYRFDGVLSMKTSQEDVLTVVAKPVIDDVLNGVNGTIFAYGQTGSGKTFTITGGAQRYADRGLIPRTIAYMFEAFRRSDSQHYRMYISYLEIYQKAGYDLLRDDSAQKLEDLPKVTLREDEDGNMHLRNLSVNVAGSEEDALNLLFLGDTNRVVAETPMNDASTRSHCLFIIWVDSTRPGSDVVRRSKLHLVDLAGSERVSKTGVEGKLLQEATDINLSLHYLERVIVALHARSKGQATHVPYRDSMMTSVLRDSLGGNCKTTMIGCIAVEPSNLQESISTCNFAQRVAQIQNNAKINEELDPNLLIARLKREVSELKAEVALAKAGTAAEVEGGNLQEEHIERCRSMVLQYISREAENRQELFVCGSVERWRTSFRILRDLCNGNANALGCVSGASAQAGGTDHARLVALRTEAETLELEIAQRDQEIGIMVEMLSKQRGGADGSRPFIPAAEVKTVGAAAGRPAELNGRADVDDVAAVCSSSPPRTGDWRDSTARASAESPTTDEALAPQPTAKKCAAAAAAAAPTRVAVKGARREPTRGPGVRPPPHPAPSVMDAAGLLLDKQHAFEVFRTTVYQPPESFEENKAQLKERMAKAKAFGDEANAVRAGINAAKARLERLRSERAMTAAGYDVAATVEDGPEELAEVREIDRLKVLYRERTGALRAVKSDVEGIQRLLEQSKARMQREFETWFSALRRQASLQVLDEEAKRELYDKVTGRTTAREATAHTPSDAGSSSNRAPAEAEQAVQTRVQAMAPRPVTETVTVLNLVEAKASGAPPALPAGSARASQSQPQAPVAAGTAVTGDSRTDDDIARFYALLGDLQ